MTEDGGVFGAFQDGVALSGNTIVVGAELDDEVVEWGGAAYVFVQEGASWVQQAKLVASDVMAFDLFSTAVDIDGDRIVIGAPHGQSGEPDAGRAYLFVRHGATWVEDRTLLPSELGNVGSGVGISAQEVVVGAPFAQPDGAAFVFPLLDGPGTALCFGDGGGAACPCGNDSAVGDEGCVNSTGAGMTIAGTGTSSVTADDLVLIAGSVPADSTGIFYAGDTPIAGGTPFYDGLQCVGGNARRFQGLVSSNGLASDTGFVAQDPSGTFFAPGAVIDFQYWSRDLGLGAPCATGANLSPAYRVLWTP